MDSGREWRRGRLADPRYWLACECSKPASTNIVTFPAINVSVSTSADKRSRPGRWAFPNAASPTYIVPPCADGEANHGAGRGQFSAPLPDERRCHAVRLLMKELWSWSGVASLAADP